MASSASAVFEALGDPTRLVLVERLESSGPQTTLRLVEGLGMSRQAATKHLEVLERAGLVVSETKGREVVRSLRVEGLKEASDWLDERRRFWDNKLDGLKGYLGE